ncbi:ArnT family glycosyltransferase [Solimicrobium silvestre]|uniref:4-amino-4-deoxy-L-arabinose transferase and related glycosyltransferases of PMT family n=1 Tax=Solimicrobium silvestre TaxID=2099400 RepID=A0A2S9GVB3_9BURK|nr:glycosyltransferase family 39 protein [Solimicrobium silvestre]PRC91653.1 4-amino-4-deoxy-L-arabinose transferase and related glycosyltransferases of PMT family [Solimicrobium silvestre]
MRQKQTTMQNAGLRITQRGMQNPDWLIWLLAFICVWAGLGAYGVLNNNEGLYAQIPREMLNSGDIKYWIIPHLNGLPYMEKPPLLYWLTALAFTLFGQADWVVRLVPSLSGLACVGLMLNFGQRIYRPQVGRLAALMFISGLGVMIISRTLLFDMLLTAFLTAALLFAYLYKLEGHKRDLRIAHVSLAFAVLTKGFVALLLFGSVTLVWIILVHGSSAWKQFSKWFDLVSICLFFAITVPWFVAASLIEPIFLWFFFVNEHVLRFLGLRIPHDFYSGSWWYYLPRMVIYLFPWSLLLPIALLSTWTRLSRVEIQEFTILRKTLVFGWLVPLLFFSISSAKANYYVIVSMPFAALNLALLLEQSDFLKGKRSTILGVVVALLTGAAAITLQAAPNLVSSELVILGLPWHDYAVIALWSATGLSLLAALLAWRVPNVGLVSYIVLPLFSMGILLVTANAMDESISDRSMAAFIQQTVPNRTVYLYRNFEQNSSLPFYLKKPLNVIDSVSSDLYWGNQLRPENTIMLSREQFKLLKEPVVVIVPNAYLDEFAHKKMHTKFIKNKQFSHATVFY